MSKVKRYEFDVYQMSLHPEGDYVSYEDYTELKAQRDALAADREKFAVQCAAAKIAVQYAQAAGFECTLNTPAVDAYLNSVRAEGLEILTGKLQQLIDEGVFDAKEIGVAAGAVYEGAQIAAQLRAGEPS